MFGSHYHFKKTRQNILKFNSKRFKIDTSSWRFDFLHLYQIFPLDSDYKIYRNIMNEYIKVTLLWIRFKYNHATKILSCTGKFKAEIRLDGIWKEL